MGFQGDVAGIGLGELLQGLSRGGREGVLTLHCEHLTATLGVQQGQLFLLPEANEDPEIWRTRVQRAWVKDPNDRIDTIRMSDIAFAARLERMFQLLDADGVHFRFEPGPLPSNSTPEQPAPYDDLSMELGGERKAPRIAVHCPGISVEYLLLEHARLSDESEGNDLIALISEHDLLRIYDPSRVVEANQRFCAECDGMSNILEIADRLSWPLRQCRAWATQMVAQGVLRLSNSRELLIQARAELSEHRLARAASRLSGWVERSDPGPPPSGDVQLLLAEWNSGKLPELIGYMPARHARKLLRRIELVEQNPRSAFLRWREMRKHHRHDLVTEVRMLALQLRSDDETIAPAMTDLLKLARNFQNAGRLTRSGVMLRAAAARLPETTSMRLELGSRMLSVGLIEEGAPWVMEACRTLIDSGHAEKALQPLRSLLATAGSIREGRRLLQLARARSARGRRRRRALLLSGSVVALLSLGAVVQLRMEHRQDRQLDEITDMINRPREALALLEQNFSESNSSRVEAIRMNLISVLQEQEGEIRDRWLDHYREAKNECESGAPLLGLKRAFDLPPTPEFDYIKVDWPTCADLMHGLAAKLELTLAKIYADDDETQGELDTEERLASLLDELQAEVDARPGTPDVEGFQVRLNQIRVTIDERRVRREELRIAREQLDLQLNQDSLLAAARAHQQAGDLERAVRAYRALVATPDSEILALALKEEIQEAEDHYAALLEARHLAEKGEHERALEVLSETCPNPSEHPLTSHIDSEPQGAQVTFSDGSTRTTPFDFLSSPGETLDFVLELEGHEDYRIEMDNPSDQFALMSRLPDQWWRTDARVDAPPVSIGGDHIVADRAGMLVRLGPDSQPVWKCQLASLAGIARAPVFLPGLSTHMLAITEDGQAWLVEAQSGKCEGPYEMGVPPFEGPTAKSREVTVRFTDGTLARWTTHLAPDVTPPDEAGAVDAGDEDFMFGPSAGLEILRRRSGASRVLASPWSEWVVSIDEGYFTVTKDVEKDEEAVHFRVRRRDPWAYVAWEAPNSRLPNGRLWVSDAAGLRSFEP